MLTWRELANKYDEFYNITNSDEIKLAFKYDELAKLLNVDANEFMSLDWFLVESVMITFSDNDRNLNRHDVGPYTEEFIKALGGLEGYDTWDCEHFNWFVEQEMKKNPPSVPSVVTVSGTADLPVTVDVIYNLDVLSCRAEDEIMARYGFHHDEVDKIRAILKECFGDNILELLAKIAVKDFSIELPDPSLSIKDMEEFGYRFVENKMLPLSKERAMEIRDKADITVYALYEDNSEAAIDDVCQFDEHKSLFGIELDDWKIAKPRLDVFDKMIESDVGL